MGQMSVNMPASLRSTTSMLRTLTADRETALSRLTSGLKINTAIQGPQQFFASRGLNQRAGDLDGLKSGMAQAISTVQAASAGVASVKGLLDQARGLTTVTLATLDNTPAAISMRRELAEQFDGILRQIDKFVSDSSYGGKNLLMSRPPSFAATDASVRNVGNITGINKAAISSVTEANAYRVSVTGNGAISTDATDLLRAQDTLGLAQLSVSGFNSATDGRFDDIKFELHGKPGRDAKLVVLDGDESWTTSYSQAQLKQLAESGQKLAVSHSFNSGAQINMLIDGKLMAEALDTSGVVKTSVTRDVNLSISVTNNQGVTLERSAATQDTSIRLQEGENSFRFPSGTVRLDIDPKTIQGAAETAGGITGDLGSLTGAIMPGRPTTEDLADTAVKLEVARSGFGAGAVVLNQYAGIGGGDQVWSQINGNQSLASIGGDNPLASKGEIIITPSALAGKTANAVFLYNRSAGGGGLTTVADGDFDAGEFANPYTQGWQQSAQLSLTYGAVSNGRRTVSIDDGLGGSFNGSVEDKGDGQPVVIRLSGGVNNGATIGLFHKDGSAGSRAIDVHLGLDSYAVADDAATAAASSFNSLGGWSGIGTDSNISVSIGASNSAGLGLRTVSITHTAMDGSIGVTDNLTMGNGAGPTGFTLSSGARIQFDAAAGANNYSWRVAAMSSTASRAAELTIRSVSLGEKATMMTEQVSVGTAENDLTVNLNANGSSALEIKAVNLGSGPLGLGIDNAANGWRDRSDVNLAINDLERANIRLMSSLRSLDVNMDILNTRADFTAEFSEVLRDGSRKLVVADDNNESAKVLTADLRRQLATTMVSLMTQQQQRILSLF
jgi:flagellin-like hook-associated protein FlgL